MRWQAWFVAGVAAFTVHGTAWAEDKDEAKPKRPKEARELAHERHEVVIEGLAPEQVERALGMLKAEHPGVAAKGKDGTLKLAAKDGKALDAAVAALETSGVPMGKVWRGVTHERKQDGMDPARAALKKQLHDVEEALAAARAAGASDKVAELERQRDLLHEMRKAMGQMHEDHARAMKEKARLAPRDAHDPEAGALLAYLEQMSRPDGERRGPPRRDPALEERMRHARQALEHLQAAGLADQSERVRHALERMERATRDQAHGPRPMEAGHGRPHPQETWQLDHLVRPGMPPRPPAPPHVAHRRPHVGGTLPEGAPPSVGGTRRGAIHRRPCLVPMPPAPPAPPAPPHGRHMSPDLTYLGDKGTAEWLDAWVKHPDAVRRDGPPRPRFDKRAFETVRPGPDTMVVVGADGTRKVMKLDRLPKTEREVVVIGPEGARPPHVPGPPRPVRAVRGTDAATDQAQIERLRAEMDALKKQLHDLLRALEKQPK